MTDNADASSGNEASSAQLLSQITVGTRVEVYWELDKVYYPGVIATHSVGTNENDLQGHHVYRIHYDDGYKETRDFAKECFRIITQYDTSKSASAEEPPLSSLVGDRVPVNPPREFQTSDYDYEIYWPVESVWSAFRPDQAKIRFYSYSLSTQRCEVEWNKRGVIYHTKFRQAKPAKSRERKKVDNTIYEAGDVPKKSQPTTSHSKSNKAKLLSQITVGTRVEVYWENDKVYYPGVVAAHCPNIGADVNNLQGYHVYRIHYDDGDEETLDFAKERFHIIGEPDTRKESDTSKSTSAEELPLTSLVGNREPQNHPPEAFLISDNDYEIYWPPEGVWSAFRPDQDKIRFYSCSFSTQRCEVEWDKQGVIYHTKFRQAKPAKSRERKKVDKFEVVGDVPKKRARPTPITKSEAKLSPRDKDSSSNNGGVAKLDPDLEPHFITRKLGLKWRNDLIKTLPNEFRVMLRQCCWVRWNGKGVHRPALILSPFDMGGNENDGGIAAAWLEVYLKCKKNDNMSQLPHILYWYEGGWSNSKYFKAFSLVRQEMISSYETGIAQGWHTPFSEKIADPYGMLTEEEDDIIRGISQMQKDQNLPEDCRGGPMFFPYLRDEASKEYEERIMKLEDQYASWKESDRYKACTSQATFNGPGENSVDVVSEDMLLASLELCAGTEVLSQALNSVGFETATLDNDLKRDATSNLSLEQLEARIVSGQIRGHPYLNRPFSIVWAAPECRTWSVASNGRYRNKQFVDGFKNRALEKDALQARSDIESLVNILSYYKRLNSDLIIVIENPVGYLKDHPVSRLFSEVLELEMVDISYCQFSTKAKLYPQKDTNLWTNSPLILYQFGHKRFQCNQKDCLALGSDGKHIVQAQDLSDRCSSYPVPMCRLIAGLLYSEAVKGSLRVGNLTRRSSSCSDST